jgi:SAM-dependent methyltransferase
MLTKVLRSVRDHGLLTTFRKATARLPFRRFLWQRKLRELHRMFGTMPRSEIFEYIYRRNIWASPESASGSGSTLKATESMRNHLGQIVKEFEVRSIYDAPCGDFNWMRLVMERSPQIVRYVGADIVPEIIRRNERRFGSKRIMFVVRDIVVDRFPSGLPFDLWMCRDCLIHLSFLDILRMLENFCSSEIKYMLTDTFLGAIRNMDIDTGHFRLNDLFAEPFSFPREAVKYRLNDYIEGDPPKEMVLFAREDIAAALPKMRDRLALGGFPMAPVR